MELEKLIKKWNDTISRDGVDLNFVIKFQELLEELQKKEASPQIENLVFEAEKAYRNSVESGEGKYKGNTYNHNTDFAIYYNIHGRWISSKTILYSCQEKSMDLDKLKIDLDKNTNKFLPSNNNTSVSCNYFGRDARALHRFSGRGGRGDIYEYWSRNPGHRFSGRGKRRPMGTQA
jgi:hypothetical protein